VCVTAGTATASLIVENAYRWIGSAVAGMFVVYLDGKRAGATPLGSQLMLHVDPGQHSLRVRLWWYLSPLVQLTVEPGQTRRFSADIPRQRMVLARIMRGMFDPFHSLSLKEVIP
jgi:hypothetical protein